jgi:hypothetical protein
MLPLKDLEEAIGCCCCAASSCTEKSYEVFVTLEGREIPLCELHFNMVSSGILW